MEKLPESNKISTNEEIIDEITKNLEQCTTASNCETNKTEVVSGNIPFENDDSDLDSDNDLINEESLKELEKNLNDLDKENRRKSALELKTEGNEQFKVQEFKNAIKLYTKALRICPLKYTEDRSVLYSNRATSKVKLELTQSAIEDCSKAIELNANYLKPLLKRAELYEKDNKLDESFEDYKKILTLDKDNREANLAVQRLPPKIQQRNEELKTEMLGKLKDLGNMFLRPFGLSTENFKMQQDPNTGSYSINFQQN